MNEAGIYLDNNEQMKEFAYLMLTDNDDVLARTFRPFSFLIYAYETNGSLEQIGDSIADGKKQIKYLEDNFPSYEYLQKLKDFESCLSAWSGYINKDALADYMKYSVDGEEIKDTNEIAEELKEILE